MCVCCKVLKTIKTNHTLCTSISCVFGVSLITLISGIFTEMYNEKEIILKYTNIVLRTSKQDRKDHNKCFDFSENIIDCIMSFNKHLYRFFAV